MRCSVHHAIQATIYRPRTTPACLPAASASTRSATLASALPVLPSVAPARTALGGAPSACPATTLRKTARHARPVCQIRATSWMPQQESAGGAATTAQPASTLRTHVSRAT